MTELSIKVIAIFLGFLAVAFTVSALSGLLIRASRRGTEKRTTWNPEIVSWQTVTAVLGLIAAASTALRSPLTATVLVAPLAILGYLTRKIFFGEMHPPRLLSGIVLLVFTAGAAVLCTSAFVSWPVDLPEFFGPVFASLPWVHPQTVEHEITLTNQVVAFRDISASLQPEANGRLASLKLDASTLVFNAGSDPVETALDRLNLVHGGRIVTNGATLTIRAKEIDTDNSGSIVSFEDNNDKPPKAAPGRSGFDGRSGGHVTLAAQVLVGTLKVDLRGQDGGAGGDGLPGVPGAPGRPGQNASDSFVGCRNSATDGSIGQPGGSGGPGGPGGKGGDGGSLELHGSVAQKASSINLSADGGKPGEGGEGGIGGIGGSGGQGGNGSSFCSGGRAGPPGPNGFSGAHGDKGTPGTQGANAPKVM